MLSLSLSLSLAHTHTHNYAHMQMTEAEHPVLGLPFYQMHPCNTAALMAAVAESSRPSNLASNATATPTKTAHSSALASAAHGIDNGDYVKSWISLTGQVVGLSLPLSYHTALDYCLD